jgi:hypothetical protein
MVEKQRARKKVENRFALARVFKPWRKLAKVLLRFTVAVQFSLLAVIPDGLLEFDPVVA